jgi:hypothetical protein
VEGILKEENTEDEKPPFSQMEVENSQLRVLVDLNYHECQDFVEKE